MSSYKPDPKYFGHSTPEDSKAVGKYLLVILGCLAAAIGFVLLAVFLFKKPHSQAATKQQIQPAFYFWKTRFEPNETERDALNFLKIKKLYLKLFDVDLDETSHEAAPTAILELDSSWNSRSVLVEKELVGCVFLTNRVFENPSLDVDFLSKKCLVLIEKINQKLSLGRLAELQFDCDWTATTRTPFFLFLKKIEAQKPRGLQISATIRLHQLRFSETGVPPVERGMLMLYNTGNLDDEATENSILDTTVAKNYLTRFSKYPLPLDVALPIFRWGIVFRDGQFFKLINALDSTQLVDNELFSRQTENRFSVTKATFLEGHFLHEGDEIRLESPAPAALEWAANRVSPVSTIAFFHLDSSAVRAFSPFFLEKIIRAAE